MGEQRTAIVLLLILCFAMSTLPLVRASEDYWTALEPRPSPVNGMPGKSAIVNGKIHIIGVDYNFVYDPKTDAWTNKTPMPTQRIDFAVASCQNKIYVIGGIVGDYTGVRTGVNEVYDPVTDSWENKTAMPTKRSQLNANVANGKIYLIGGRTGQAYSTVALNQVYDPETDTWTSKKSIPYPVVDYASAVVDNKIYVIGGQDEYRGPMELDFAQIYNSENDTWSISAPMPTASWQAAAGTTTGTKAPKRIYVMGGSGGFGLAVDQNFIYDPVADAWSSGLPLPTPRYLPAVAVVDDLIYVIGGAENFAVGSVMNERYTPVNYIPEFPSWIILPLFLTATLFAVIIKKKVYQSAQKQ